MTDTTSTATAAADTAATPSSEGRVATTPAAVTPADARARRDEITNDPALREKYIKGDVALRQEMRALNQMIAANTTAGRVDAVLAGATHAEGRLEFTSDEHPLSTSTLANIVNNDLKKWYPDDTIRSILDGSAQVTPQEKREALRVRELLLRDREFLVGYRAGHREKRQLVKNINAVLSVPVADVKG